jgi:hypothetical protein
MKKYLAFFLFLVSLPTWAAIPSTIALAVSAKPEWYWSFWQGETASGYREKVLAAVKHLLAETAPDTKIIEMTDSSLPDELYQDKAPWSRHQALCNETAASDLLVLRVQDTFPVISPWQGDLFWGDREVPSAHWPALYLTVYDCQDGKRLAEHPILSPRITEHFVFETDLVSYTLTFWKKAIAPSSPNE